MLLSLRFWSRTMVHFAGDRTRRRRPTMPRFLKRWRRVAYFTVLINQQAEPVGRSLRDKHYLRKHGSNAYYGQAKESK
jgi:hypothetical protein